MQQQEAVPQLLGSPEQPSNQYASENILKTPTILSQHRQQNNYDESNDNLAVRRKTVFIDTTPSDPNSSQNQLRIPLNNDYNQDQLYQYFCSPEPSTLQAVVDCSPPSPHQQPRKACGMFKANRVTGTHDFLSSSSSYICQERLHCYQCSSIDKQYGKVCFNPQCRGRLKQPYERTDSKLDNTDSSNPIGLSSAAKMIPMHPNKLVFFSSGGEKIDDNMNTDSQSLADLSSGDKPSFKPWGLANHHNEECLCKDRNFQTLQSCSELAQQVQQECCFQLKGILSPKLDFWSNLNLPSQEQLPSDFQFQDKTVNASAAEESTMTTSCLTEKKRPKVKNHHSTSNKKLTASLLKNIAIDFNQVVGKQFDTTSSTGQKSNEKGRSLKSNSSLKKASSKIQQSRHLTGPSETFKRGLNFLAQQQHLQYSGKKSDFVITENISRSGLPTFDQQLLSSQRYDFSDFEQDSENTSQLNNEATMQRPILNSLLKKVSVSALKLFENSSNCNNTGGVKQQDNHWQHKTQEKEISEISGFSSQVEEQEDSETDDDLQSLENCSISSSTIKNQQRVLYVSAPQQSLPQLGKKKGLAIEFERATAAQQQSGKQNDTKSVQMDRFIPCRTKENLQAKFEAASQNRNDFLEMKRLPLGKTAKEGQLGNQSSSMSRQQQVSNIQTATPVSPRNYQNIFGGVSQPQQLFQATTPVTVPLPERHQNERNQSTRPLIQTVEVPFSLPSLDPLSLNPQHSLPVQPSTPLDTVPPLERPVTKTQSKPNEDGQERLKSYNKLLEKSIFFEKDTLIKDAQKTNLTTDINKDSSLMQGLSLMYQTSCQSIKKNPSRSIGSCQSADDLLEPYFMNENNFSSSSLQSEKILEFKKSLSMNEQTLYPNLKNDYPSVSILSETNRLMKTKSIVEEYTPRRSALFESPIQVGCSRANPLSSMDYLTTDMVGINRQPNNCGSSPDNILINKIRKIAPQPYKILDAPNLCDDFYLNLVDWSAANTLAVALGQNVFIWNANTSSVTQLVDLGERSRVTSVSWSQRGTHLSVGTQNGQVQIWDVQERRCVRIMGDHKLRVSACAWSGSVVASGSKDKSILVRDVRTKSSYIQRLTSHKQEVCGLRWSPHDEKMLASGGNDNKLMIWNVGHGRSTSPQKEFGQHTAAVKAINWSPLHRGLLATGGGTADQHIRFWNTLNNQPIGSINTGSQVCNLVFSKTNDELVSTHGYSLNQVIVWKYPTMEKIATLTGHTYRVLYLAMSPDGSSIVTGAGDETLRFWNVFPKSRSSRGAICGNEVVGSGTSSLFPSNVDFR